MLKIMPVFVTAFLSGTASAQRANTCNLWQTCASNAGVMPGDKFGTCDDASLVTEPIFIEGGYAPTKMKNGVGTDAMANACPYMDLSHELCCNQDNAQIMGK